MLSEEASIIIQNGLEEVVRNRRSQSKVTLGLGVDNMTCHLFSINFK